MKRTSKQVAVVIAITSLTFSMVTASISNAAPIAPKAAVSSGGTIKIGILHPFTGNYAGVGAASIAGAKVAAALINASGGILGKKLVITTADTLGDPADAVPALNKLLNIDHVVAVVGPGGLEAGSTIPILDRNKIPYMLQSGNTKFDKMKDQYGFRVNPSDGQLSVAMALFAIQQGYRKAAMVFSTIDSAQTLKPAVVSTFTKLGGKIVVDVNLTPAQTSYSSEALKVSGANPDVIFTQMEPPTGSVFFTAMEQTNGLTTPFVGSDITAGSDFVSAVTAARATKVLYSIEGASVSGAATNAFNAEYKKILKGAPLASASYAYDATILLALAITQAKSTKGPLIAAAIMKVSNAPGVTVQTYAAGLKALKAGKKINYDGASGPMDFDKYHNVFGPFEAVKSDASGNFVTFKTMTALELMKAS
ncbi:MAG TPA: ABC transporter substrate-binding protein [Candidatus Nanopelagicaceae bacterium]